MARRIFSLKKHRKASSAVRGVANDDENERTGSCRSSVILQPCPSPFFLWPTNASLSKGSAARRSGVRFEPEDALDRGERTHSSTVRAFHQADATVGKSFEIDGNHSRERAVGCFARLFLFLRRFHRFRCFRRVLMFFFRDGLPFGLFPIHTCWFCFVLILTSGVGTCS